MTQSRAAYLNSCCACQTLDQKALAGRLAASSSEILPDALAETHPHLFAHERVFVSAGDAAVMRQTVETLSAVSGTAAYREQAMSRQRLCKFDPPHTLGVFNSFDFHLTPHGPALIEINTNAGGAFLSAAAAQAHGLCCGDSAEGDGEVDGRFAQRVVAMFESEWRLSGHIGPLRTIAIVDDAPQDQFLYPDFLLAKSVLDAAGYQVVIADASQLELADGSLSIGGQAIDLVYNRLTDFRLEEPHHDALRRAVETSAAVVTPHPFHHALLADKRNLVWLSNRDNWNRMDLKAADLQVLERIPHGQLVSEFNAERLWLDKKNLFFKPFDGHGSKGVYRGDKLTKATWENIKKGSYLAQARIPPSERVVLTAGVQKALKFDVRVFTYGAEILLFGARLYQGQVTNMRTVSGGLAPVSIG